MSVKISTQQATEIFDSLVGSRRNLESRDWAEPATQAEKKWLIAQIEKGYIELDISKREARYHLSDPVGEIEIINVPTTVKQDTVASAAKEAAGGDEIEKSVALLHKHTGIPKLKFAQMDAADFVAISRLFGFFIQ